jgi:predicted transcriptional regulator
MSDAVWDLLSPFLPGQPGQWGGVAEDNRQFLNGVFWILKTGSPWRDLPSYYGNWNSVARRFRRWCSNGIWDKVLEVLKDEPDYVWLRAEDSYRRVHPSAPEITSQNREHPKEDTPDNNRKKPSLSKSEWGIMTIIWEAERPLTASFIMDNLVGRAWGLSTVMTVLARLCKKGFVHCDRSTGSNYYSALISGEDYRKQEGREFLDRAFGNSIANMVAALTSSGAVSEDDISELRKILEQGQGQDQDQD